MTAPTIQDLHSPPAIQNGVGSLAQTHGVLTHLLNVITETGKPAAISQEEGVPKATIDAINAAIDAYSTDFVAAQTAASAALTDINQIIDVITATSTWVNDCVLFLPSLKDEIKKSTSSATVTATLKGQLTELAAIGNIYKTDIAGKQVINDHDRGTLAGSSSKLSGDLNKLSNAVPAGTAPPLNLSKLTQTEAAAELTKRINTLNSDISDLGTEITNLTVAQAAAGIGIAFGVLNWWNPIGWAFMAGGATGEYFATTEKAKDVAKKTADQTELGIDKAEQDILKPYYSIKNMTGVINTGVNDMESISSSLSVLVTDFGTAAANADLFIKMIGVLDPKMLDTNLTMMEKSYLTLQTVCNQLMGTGMPKPPTRVLSPAEFDAILKRSPPA